MWRWIVSRHDVDVVSLVSGLVFAAIAGAYAIVRATNASFDAHWVFPALFIGLGLVLGAVAVRRLTSSAAAATDPPAEV
jgi:hypothetical protein